jgi:hypothetical protein
MKKTAVEWLVDELLDSKPLMPSLIEQAKELEKKQQGYSEEVICKHCKKPISVKDINNHLFMAIKSGGLIHWNCKNK